MTSYPAGGTCDLVLTNMTSTADPPVTPDVQEVRTVQRIMLATSTGSWPACNAVGAYPLAAIDRSRVVLNSLE